MKGNIKRLETSEIKNCLIALCVGFVVLLGMNGVFAALVVKEAIPQKSEGYLILASILASSYVCAAIFTSRWKTGRLIGCLVSGMVMFILLTIINAVLFEAKYSGVMVTAMLIFCGSALAAFSAGGKKSRGGSIKFR